MPPNQSIKASSFLERITEDSGLTHSQIQIWVGQKVHPQSPFCNMAFGIEIEGEIDVETFEQAWAKVVSENSVLRTRILELKSVPQRSLTPPADFSLEKLDFSNHEQPANYFRSWARKRCSTLLPLEGKLVESAIVKLAPNAYAWYLNQHHLITDATSTVRLYQAISDAYEQLTEEQAAAVSNFEDYYEVSSKISDETAEIREHAKQHWSTKGTQTERLTPIYGRKGDAAQTESSRLEYQLDERQSERIRKLASEPELQSLFPDISTFAVFSTLLSAFLYRSSGQNAVSFDSPAANRSTRSAKNALGCFIEMFPLDLQVEEGATFRSLAAHCMEEIHSFLQNVSNGASSPSGSNTSNVVLNLFTLPFGSFAGCPTRAEWIHSGHIDGVYDFKLQVHDYNADGRYTLHFDLSESTFTAEDQQRIQFHFISMLDAMIENLDTPIAAVDILSESERNHLLIDYNRPSLAPIPTDTVIERIARQAAATPDRIALRQQSKTLTYKELWDQVEASARCLNSRGIGPESCVALIMPRSQETILSILAVLRAGAAYIPIDPTYPEERIAKILADSGANCHIKSFSELLDGNKRSELPPFPKSGDLAYVIYTSGSTGQPKGVEIEHRGLVDYIDWAEREYVRGEQLTYPLFTSLSFDLTVTSLFLPLVTGGELVVYPQTSAEVDSAVIDVINENTVDFIKLTPSHLSLLKQLDLKRSRISRLVLGGEDLKLSLASTIAAQFGHPVELYNEYGPTECVVGCMIHRFDPTSDFANESSVPIGRPADHVSLYLLNDRLQPVPEGAPGELCIARNGIARGYRNDPEKTALSFVANPYRPGERLYRTGDLARFSAKGVMTYLGRIDKQVKISGHRIELGEIEATLLRHPSVRNAFVSTRAPDIQTRPTGAAAHCTRCGLSSHYPNIVFNAEGVCSVCDSYHSIKGEASHYFSDPESLKELFKASRNKRRGNYDCMVFFSGGKDSAYALCQLVDMGLNVYAFTLDNGYLSDQAMANISRVTKSLGVEHEFATTPAMNEIFRDSLTRFSNVCNGCFKTIYTLGMNRANELGIPIIVTGLSRGQFFETRLTGNLFENGRFSPQDVDEAVLEARKRYHRDDDAVSRCLDVSKFQDDSIFEEIQFVDFYRYWDAPLEEIYSYLDRRVPWIRPSDTGRSTNCRVNDVGIYIHQKERGFHNYSLPYSWDVRLEQKKREEAIEELDDKFDLAEVRQMLAEIGYDEDRIAADENRVELVAYYEADSEIEANSLLKTLERHLPPQMRPRHIVHIDSMPLTKNGKVDEAALPQPLDKRPDQDAPIIEPNGPVQEHVFSIWSQTLNLKTISVTDSFFQLGGTSLTAMEITLQICQDFEIDLPLQTIFQHPTIAQLSSKIENTILEEIESLSEEDANNLLSEESPS
ncbi:ExsB family [Verrucomicrobiia bacterium DG1235]|nr:ExsB family [Verrucomicrobiae bacterium DG1235]